MNLISPLDEGWTIFYNCEYDYKIIKLYLNKKKFASDKINFVDCSDVSSCHGPYIQFYQHMEQLTNTPYESFPFIFKDGKYIGTLNKLMEINI